MGLEHRTRPAVGRAVPPRVDLDRARRAPAAQLPRPHPRLRAPARCAPRAGRPPGCRIAPWTHRDVVGPRGGVRRALRRPRARRVARQRARGARASRASRSWARLTARSARSCATTSRRSALTVDRAGRLARNCRRASSTTASASSSVCAPPLPSCRSTSPAASRDTSATSSRPSAEARWCTARRCPTPRWCSATGCSPSITTTPRPPARARRRGRGDAAAEAWLDATAQRLDRARRARRRRRCRALVLHRARGPRRLPGQHRLPPGRHHRRRDLRGLPDHPVAQRRPASTPRRLSRPARPQPRAARGAAAPRRRVGAELLARALPARRPRPDRRVAADQGHRAASRTPDGRRLPAPPSCAPPRRPAPSTS